MLIDSSKMVSITEANQNFSRVARMVDENGEVVILKNNRPVYKITFIPQEDQPISEEELLAISKRLIERNRQAYEVLAQ